MIFNWEFGFIHSSPQSQIIGNRDMTRPDLKNHFSRSNRVNTIFSM